MNYLAHAYLSFGQQEILCGNMISDFVKGRQIELYPLAIQQGIRLHRSIDTFTDQHPVTHEAMVFFKPAYRLYAGAFVDVVYDHFLALDTMAFASADALLDFSVSTYQQLRLQEMFLPERFKSMLPFMESQNWLYHYRFREGIEKSFGGLVRRAAYMNDPLPGWEVFNTFYAELQECYRRFFPELKAYTIYQTGLLKND